MNASDSFPGRAAIAIFGLALLVTPPLRAQYQPFALLPPTEGSRRQHVEVYGLGGWWHADDIKFEGIWVPDPDGNFLQSDVNLALDDTGMFGFGLGWTINDHFAIKAEFEYGEADYRATWQDYYLSGEMAMHNLRFNVDYNLLAAPFTPFVTAGIGYHYFDTGIPTGPPGYYCWWDYWWGYVCTGYVETYSEFDFAANAGGGLRWDINDNLFIQAQALVNWVDMGNGANWPHHLQAMLLFGGKF
jgi:opacity protein-like surface antigen